MSKRAKLIFRISLAFNVLLVSIVAWGYFNTIYVTERVLTMNVTNPLFGLENKIAHQIDHDWSDPSLVKIELEQILIGISHSQNVGIESNTLSNDDMETLDKLSDYLSDTKYFPLETLESYSEITEEDKTKFENLREALREVGFDIEKHESFNSWDKDSLMVVFSELADKNNAQ